LVAVCKIFWRKFSAQIQVEIKKVEFYGKITLSKSRHAVCKRENMSALATKGSWNIAKGRLKQKLAQLAGDELQFIEGKEDELTGRIQRRASQAGKKIEQTTIKRMPWIKS
jgi:uncharacterized protein YjbJ (UPF0337 family)